MQQLLSISEPWLSYAILAQHPGEDEAGLGSLKTEALADAKIKAYLKDISDFHSILVRNHKNPDLPIHKLLFLLDLGFASEVPEVAAAIDQILEHVDKNGVYQSLTNIPKHFGGKGEDEFGWCLCDAPLLLLALLKAGVDYPHLEPGVEHLLSLHRSPGFPCLVSEEFGTFRGPGAKGDPCPYATLVMLRLLAELDGLRDGDVASDCIDAILALWEQSLERHPYQFYMGTDFRKLKAPLIWYDILSVADCLSRFAQARTDARFAEILAIIRAKEGDDGMYTPESVYQKCIGWCFGQKKTPSPYLTFLVRRMLARC